MDKEQARALPKNTPNPLFDGLSDYVKHPANYHTIQKKLIETMTCGKLHSEASQMFTCTKCTENMIVRRKLMKGFGFTSPAQYLAWKKVHETIKERMPLDKYNSMKA